MNPILHWLANDDNARMAEVISTQEKEHPLPDDLDYFGDLAYTGSHGASLFADVYRPKDTPADLLPIALFVHGGGLFTGTRKANRAYAEILADRGYVVFNTEYRLLSESDSIGSIQDVCDGLSYLKTHATALGGDLSRILVIGESAGALLALYACALTRSPLLQEKFGIEAPKLSVRGLACFGGMFYTAEFDPIGLMYRQDMYGERLRDASFKELVNPEDPRVTSSLPPVFMVTSAADFLKGYTLRFNKALTMAGHDHRLIYYRRGKELVHAFPSRKPELPQSTEVLNELDAWFKGL